MSFAVVIEGMTFFSFVVMIAGGKQKRESGWKILAGLLFLIGGIQCAGMALIVKPYSLLRPLFPNRQFEIPWANCQWHPRPRASGRVLVISIDLLIRERRSVFPGVAPRYFVDAMHDQLEYNAALECCCHLRRLIVAD